MSDEELGGFICATVSDALRTPNKEWAQAFINATVNFARGMGVTEVDTYLSLLRRMSPTHLVVLRFMRSSHPGVRLNQGDIVETLSREIAKEAPELRGRMDHLRLAVQDAIDWRLLPYERHSIGVLNPQETEMLSLHKPRLTALGRGLVGFVEEHGGEGEGG